VQPAAIGLAAAAQPAAFNSNLSSHLLSTIHPVGSFASGFAVGSQASTSLPPSLVTRCSTAYPLTRIRILTPNHTSLSSMRLTSRGIADAAAASSASSRPPPLAVSAAALAGAATAGAGAVGVIGNMHRSNSHSLLPPVGQASVRGGLNSSQRLFVQPGLNSTCALSPLSCFLCICICIHIYICIYMYIYMHVLYYAYVTGLT
jgi:hypothetical protein